MIRKFIQGDPATDRDLFCIVGQWAVSEAVHDALGMPVTGRDGDVWFILSDAHGPACFCQARLQKNGTAHLRYLYFNKLPDGKKLLEGTLDELNSRGVKAVFTNDRRTATIWDKYGFTAYESNRKGSFVRWQKELK